MADTPSSPMALLDAAAARTPEALLVHHLASGRRLTYGEAATLAHRLVGSLARAGVGRRDRVVLAVRNHWCFFPLLAACGARRAARCPVDPYLHRDELAHILADASPALAVFADEAAVARAGALPDARSLDALLGEAPVGPAPDPEADPSDPVLLIYTSGTTGGSKCVQLTSANLLADATLLADRYGISAADRFYCTLPTHHMNAILMTGLLPLVAGASVVLDEALGFRNARRYWRILSEHAVSVFSLVPSIMALLLQLFPDGGRADNPALRFGFCGAAPLDAELWQRFEERFGCVVYQGYGLTETTCWATSSPPGEPRRYGSVGLPLPGCTVQIDASKGVDPELLRFGAGGGSDAVVGEVLIGGPIVSPGYFKNPRATAACTSSDGFWRTGDLGFLDAGGHLQICGRIKDVIIRNAANIFSGDLDALFLSHPEVVASKTFGVPDPLVGERVHTAAVLREGSTLTEIELRTWAQARLSRHLWPDLVSTPGHLPAGAAGKVSTGTLRKILTGALAEEVLASLNSWRFKRAQSGELGAVREIVQHALVRGRPMPFLSYWGCGPRDGLADVDEAALQRLHDYLQGALRLPAAPPRLTLILTDVHAHNNGIPADRMERYFAAIGERAHELGMVTVRLGELWREAGLRMDEVRAALDHPEARDRWAAEPLRPQLIRQAERHVAPGLDAEEAARFYLHACRCEGLAIAARYPGHVFLTYNPPKMDLLSPPLPKLYLSSFKEGTSVKPWFVG